MPKTKLTLRKILDMHRAISSIGDSGFSVTVLTGVDLAINQSVLKPHVDGRMMALKYSEEYSKYVKELTAVQMDEAAKKDGKPVTFGNMVVFENPRRAEIRIDTLDRKYAAAIAERKKIETEALESEKKEYTVDLIMVDPDSFKGESPRAVEIMTALLPVLKARSSKQ